MKHRYILLFSLIVTILIATFGLAACNRSLGLKDSLLGASSCLLPCWQGITPGITTSNDALQILQKSTLIAKKSVTSSNPQDDFGGATWKWRTEDSQLDARLWWRDGAIREVILPTSDISIDEIIKKFGIPEKIHVIPIGTPEDWEWGVTLYYPANGFQVQINGLFGLGAFLKPSDKVTFITLFEPSTIKERITFEGFDFAGLNPFLDWKGYGSISELYNSP